MASSVTPPPTTITACCACRTFNLTIHFPSSTLPIACSICLCNSCRQISGSCGVSFIQVPTSYTVNPSTFSLSTYSTSTNLLRYFCSTCGAHVLCHNVKAGHWALATGLCDRTEGIIQWTGCSRVEDTLDGGVSVWLKDIATADGSKRELKRWIFGDGENGEFAPPEAVRKSSPEVKPRREGLEERLKAQCHCGGVKFYITRPNETSMKASSPFPDLMIPYHTGASSANPGNKTWWLCENDTKYLAGTCTCKSCRLASGFEIQTWAFVPKCNIFQEDGKEMDYNMGTLKRYVSSKDIWREFCGTCGATIFWHCEERPQLVDVSVGLLDPEEGARVERWLDWWTARVSFAELAVSRSLIGSLENGLRDWGRKDQRV